MNSLSSWLRRQAANPQVVALAVALVGITLAIWFFGNMLAPVLSAVVIAYLLQGLVVRLQGFGVPHLPSVITVFTLFFAFLAVTLLVLLPVLVGQLTRLVGQIPQILERAQSLLLALPEQYPNFVSERQIEQLFATIGSELLGFGQSALSYSMTSVVAVVSIIVYLVLVPLLVFFMLRDNRRIMAYFGRFMPSDHELIGTVWSEVDLQIGNYVRGKFIEILIVGIVTYVVFRLLDLQYAQLLAVLTGVSVLVPYIGAAIVTVPVALVALFQWGVAPEFYYAVIAYGVIQALDGNVLAPLLFSEVVNLHPVAIIVAILFFGGVWGFWGVFFAIPLATLINAVVEAWPGSLQVATGSPPEATAD